MKINILILGHLLRHGPLHGYRLKALLDEGTSEFTSIKLPTLYYHLEQLQRGGSITGESEQSGNRPERTVFTITEQGKKDFVKLMEKALASEYQAEFLLDAVFYFADEIPLEKMVKRLKNKRAFLEESLSDMENRKEEMLKRFEGNGVPMAKAIYRHHLMHYRAEIAWLEETINELQKSDLRKRFE